MKPCRFCSYPFDQDRLGKYGCPNCEATPEEKPMIKLTLRKHPDDADMVELIERVPIRVQGRVDRYRTNVWALIHCDAFHDDEKIRDPLHDGEEVEIEITVAGFKSAG